MGSMDAIQVHDRYAADYDRLTVEYGFVLPDALFGLCFEFMQTGQRLLDVGIGTGLSSAPFARAGMAVYSLDGSVVMLKVCEKKKIAVELKPGDIRTAPWPYADQFFDHVIECGTIQFLPELEVVFSEAARLCQPAGTFTFTSKTPGAEPQAGASQGSYTVETIDGVPVYTHDPHYIATLLNEYGFERRKALKVLLSRGPGLGDDVCTVLVAQKMAGMP